MWSNATFGTLVNYMLGIVNILVAVVFALTLLVIIWRIIDAWILHGGEPGKIDEGKKTIFTGFIVLVIMASVWGLVALLRTLVY